MVNTTKAPQERYSIRFEREACSRCGGSGRYSHCEMYGDTCFRCGGSGQMLSRRGKLAYKLYAAWRESALVLLAAELTVGQQFTHGAITSRVRTISQGRCYSVHALGEQPSFLTVEIGTARYSHSMPATERVYRLPTRAELIAVAPTLGAGASLVTVEA